MEAHYLNVSGKDRGNLWQGKTITNKKGIVLDIYNESQYTNQAVSGTRFTQIAIDKRGTFLIAGDQVGCIYTFDIEMNKFWLVCQLCHCCSAITYTEIPGKDILVAVTDAKYSLYLYNSVSRKRISVMHNHKSSISFISVDDSGKRCLSCSIDLVIIWNLKTYTALHHLTADKEEICKAFFIPIRNEMITAFKNGNLFVWNSATLRYQTQLYFKEDDPEIGIKTVDASSDGFLLAAGNRHDKLTVWNMNTRDVLYRITVSDFFQSIKQVAFLPIGICSESDYLLGVVSADGNLHVYNCYDAAHITEMKLQNDKIHNIANCEKGRKFAIVSGRGHAMLIESELDIPVKETAIKTGKKYKKEKIGYSFKSQEKVKTKKEELPQIIPAHKLCTFIKRFGECPSEFRFLIWQHILQLPMNVYSFNMLVEKGEHESCTQLCQRLIPKNVNDTILRAIKRLLSAIIYWCPFFGDLTYLPLMVLPFAKQLHSNLLKCFEVVLCIICNWYQNWFLYFPLLPMSILSSLENLLAHHDKKLLQHFAKLGVTADLYAWSLLQNAFSEVLPEQHWLQLWDHIFANDLSFILFVVISFNINIRNALLQCKDIDEIKCYYQQEVIIPADKIIKKAYYLLENTPPNLNPALVVGSFTPIPKGMYPIFNKYPESNLQFKDRDRIIAEELDYLQKRKTGFAVDDIVHEKWMTRQLHQNLQDLREFNLLTNYRFKEKRRKQSCIEEIEQLETRRRKMLKNMVFLIPKSDCGNEKLEENEMTKKLDECKLRNMELLIQKKLLNEEFLCCLANLSEPWRIKMNEWYKEQIFDKPSSFVKGWYDIQDQILLVERESKCLSDQINLLTEKIAQIKKLRHDDATSGEHVRWETSENQDDFNLDRGISKSMNAINKALDARRKLVNQEQMKLKIQE